MRILICPNYCHICLGYVVKFNSVFFAHAGPCKELLQIRILNIMLSTGTLD
jgi:hypothetical protein